MTLSYSRRHWVARTVEHVVYAAANCDVACDAGNQFRSCARVNRTPTGDRDRYATIRLARTFPAVATLEAELTSLHAEIALADARISAAIRRATHRPEIWLRRLCPPTMLRGLAAAEFDALIGSPYLAAVSLTTSLDAVRITTVACADSPGVSVSVQLADGEASIETIGQDSHGRVLSAVVRVLAADGNLRDMMALVASTIGARPVDIGRPVVQPGARGAYISARLRRLLMGVQNPTGEAATLSHVCREQTELIERALLTERALKVAKLGTAPSRDKFAREFDLLTELPGVSGVRVSAGALHVETNPIGIQHDGLNYAIGRFQIDISPQMGIVKMRNLDRRMGSYHHPHVFESGHVCWGSVGPQVSRLLATGEYPAVVQHALELLRSCNRRREYL